MFCGKPASPATDPGPLEKRSEKGSKPASRSKTTDRSFVIGSFPLMPMNELLSALGAGLHSAALFCFWIRYEAATAERVSNGTPWLCQPKPLSTMPKIVMPYQLSWQFVVTKSAASAQVRGVEELVAEGA